MTVEPVLQGLVDEEVARLRLYRTDHRTVEAKSCAGGRLSRGVVDSVCAFANSGRGLLLLGIAEEHGFRSVDIDAARMADALASLCADDLEPPVRPLIELCTVDGRPVVAALVEALPVAARPCHVARRGLENGTFLRSHDGDRRATSYEVQQMLSARGRPRDDGAIVEGASVDDLDAARVAALVDRLRRTRPKVFRDASDPEILKLVGACDRETGGATLAGLLCLARYPQQFLPQLNVTFVSYPTRTGEPMQDGRRFLDNESIDGPIPLMVADAMAAVRRNMRRGAIVTGAGREDRYDYPELAVRELLVNALVHRDYHPAAQGAQVRVSQYPDRLEIESPGGLWGPLDAERLLTAPQPVSRNDRLARLLEDVESDDERRPVCENRGSGLLAALDALRRSNSEPPVVRDDLRRVVVVLRDRDVVDESARSWLSSRGLDPHAPASHGLALMRLRGRLSTAAWRAATGADEARAGAELDELLRRGLIERDDRPGGRGWRPAGGSGLSEVREAAARLFPHPAAGASVAAPRPGEGRRVDRRPRLRELLAEAPRSTVELAAAIGIGRAAVQRWLQRMEADGELAPTDPEHRRSPNNRWRPTGARADPDAQRDDDAQRRSRGSTHA